MALERIFYREEIKCRDPESNWGRQAFQACALPPELSRHKYNRGILRENRAFVNNKN